MNLRDYQIDLINQVKQSWANGYKNPCIVAPCGAGKSVMLAEMAKRATSNKKNVMFIVHRKELCQQIHSTFSNYGVDMNYCKIWMIQTLKNQLDNIEKPDLVLVDENHHALASTYKAVFEKFNCHRIGVTATPVRLDGSGLKDVNDILLESVSAKWLIENKFLSPARVFAAPLIDTSNIKVKSGEFDSRQCEELLDKSVIYGDVIKHYRDKADGKKAIIYTVSVDYSKKITEEFNKEGIITKHIDGKTPEKERDLIIQEFREGKIQCLSNCEIISEGFDVPDCECVILLRPTKSLTLYVQQSMRCMRYKEGKEAIILDHVANVFRFGLPWKDREWTLEGKKRKDKKKKGEENDNSFWDCKECYYTWDKSEGRVCPACETEIPLTEREIIKLENIKLIEITEEMFKKSRKEKREELKKIQQEKGYKKGWVWHQMQYFDKKHEEKIKNLRDGMNNDKENIEIDSTITTNDLLENNWMDIVLKYLPDFTIYDKHRIQKELNCGNDKYQIEIQYKKVKDKDFIISVSGDAKKDWTMWIHMESFYATKNELLKTIEHISEKYFFPIIINYNDCVLLSCGDFGL
jgi:superfamily II DNA or RNA helicase